MKITTAWNEDGEGGFCLLSAYGSHDFDHWGGVPEWYRNEVARNGSENPVRELVIEIPDAAVAGLFRAPTVKGEIGGAP